ncbi:MAG: hypothetical protein WAW85_11345 [Gordonia sp. (in: high G+C Gram-positive bacteria)]|uniref:hypothetical protein n=1 Tax=Gordonia sp. (in: high G+C Gram-positive bacteria) TaxID=84139 RepID=UPI003BB7F660
MNVSRRAGSALLATALGLGLATGCGDAADQTLPLTGLVLPSASVPAGYQVVPVPVDDLLSANRQTLEQATTVAFSPPVCKPTADAEFSPQLNTDNTVLLVAESDTATLSEVITTVRRDLDADRRATTGPCRVVTVVPTKGTLAGAQIVTSRREISVPHSDEVEQAVVVRSDTVTTLVDGQYRVRSALLGSALVRRPNGATVTVSVNVATRDLSARPEAPTQIAPPMDEDEYLTLFDEAIARAAR